MYVSCNCGLCGNCRRRSAERAEREDAHMRFNIRLSICLFGFLIVLLFGMVIFGMGHHG